MRSFCKTKIVATLGPSSETFEVIESLVQAGVSVFRLNFSHGSHDDHMERIRIIREVERKANRTVSILADLQGPKLRVGKFATKKEVLTQGSAFALVLDEIEGSKDSVHLPHPEIFQVSKVGDQILVNDGKIALEITKVEKGRISTIVMRGGEISDNKGVNVPGVSLPISAVTEKDKKDLEFALEHEVDWVALSFVQSAEDVRGAKEIIDGRARVLSKIEKPQALSDLNGIILESDAVMIARGDLGVELALEEVPPAQHRIINMCRKMHTPVIVATQMLESMIENETPTRAEVTDVAEAVYSGADAVMLSAESASGKYPVASVQMMHKIIQRVESDPQYIERLSEFTHENIPSDRRGSFIRAATIITEGVPTKAIVCFSTSGATALSSAMSRPYVPVVCLTPNEKTARYVNLIWGVFGFVARNVMSIREMVEEACAQVKLKNFAKDGDSILITGGFPFGKSGPPNVLRLVEVGREESYG